jgi:hypothetical protein
MSPKLTKSETENLKSLPYDVRIMEERFLWLKHIRHEIASYVSAERRRILMMMATLKRFLRNYPISWWKILNPYIKNLTSRFAFKNFLIANGKIKMDQKSAGF